MFYKIKKFKIIEIKVATTTYVFILPHDMKVH